MTAASGGPRKTIAVTPGIELIRSQRLFDALELLLPVSFRALTVAPDASAVIDTSSTEMSFLPARPTIRFAGTTDAAERRSTVTLSRSTGVDHRLRGISLLEQAVDRSVAATASAEILATSSAGPCWVRSVGENPTDRVAARLPAIGDGGSLVRALTTENSLSTVALVQFLRTVCEDSAPPARPIAATIIFDDPNVRRSRYGFIDFRELVAHADAHNYHASMAIVPLDARRADAATASLFKARSDRLSLTCHGNNHLRDELFAVSDDKSGLALGAQALRRMTRFEARTGLPIDRVMTPPHGLYSASVASALAAVGFDALCAIHPEPWSEASTSTNVLAGWGQATFSGPIGVIRRIPLFSPDADLALTAFTGSPLVLYGHHQDLADGLEPLEQASSRVNAVGPVRWMSMSEIARSSCDVRTHGELATLRPHARQVALKLPAGTHEIVVRRPHGSGSSVRGWSLGAAEVRDFDEAVPVDGGTDLLIQLHPAVEIDAEGVALPGWSPWPALRRIVTEARDRTMPVRQPSPTER